MSGAIPPLPNTSWRGAQLKHRDNFTLFKSCEFIPFNGVAAKSRPNFRAHIC